MVQQEGGRGKVKAPAGVAGPYRSLPAGWPVGLVAAALGLLLYANTLGHQYVLDDSATIWDNWIVKSGLNAESVKLVLIKEYFHGASSTSPTLSYRPVSLLMFAAEWQLSPNNPRMGHLMNVLLYALTGWLLWTTLRRVLSKQPPAMVAAAVLLFMAHPIHTEVVANIKSRDEILALLFGTATLYAVWRHLEQGSWRWLAGAVLLYTLALFSKESSITLLAVFPLTIWFFHDVPLSRNIRVFVLLLVPTIAYWVARSNALGPQTDPEEHFSALGTVYLATDDRLERLATAFMMAGHYLKVLVFPYPLVSDMGYPQVVPVGFGDWRSWVGLGLFAGLLTWTLTGLRGRRFSSYAILWGLTTFSMASNIFILIGTHYGERLLYLPSLGFALLLAWGLAKLGRIFGGPSTGGKVFYCAVAVVLVLYSVRTVTRNTDWRSDFDLTTADLPKSPSSATLNHHYGIEALTKGLEESGAVVDTSWVMQAIETQTKAIRLFSEYPNAFAERGFGWLALAEYDKAKRDLEQALTYRPDLAPAWSNLGLVHYRTQQFSEAGEFFTKAIQYAPSLVDSHQGLGSVFAETGRLPQAIEQWEAGLKYEPGNETLHFLIAEAWSDLGSTQYGNQRLAEAEESFKRAIQYAPHFVDAHQSLGTVFAVTGRFPQAIEQWEEGLKYEPDNKTLRIFIAAAWSELGSIQYGVHQLTEAEESFKKAIYYAPHLVEAHQNLGAIFTVTGRLPQAIEQWKEGLKYAPDNGTLLFFIGSAYRDMGQESLGQPWLERAKEQGWGEGSGP